MKLQAGWDMTPTVVTEKKVFQYEYDTLDLEDIFDGKNLAEVISALTERYEFLLTNKAIGLNVYDIKFKTEYGYDGDNDSIMLVGKYLESDSAFEYRTKKHQEQLAAKEAQERYTYEQLKKKFEGETNAK